MGMQFSGVTALEGVDFDLHPGEVHGLVGCNGDIDVAIRALFAAGAGTEQHSQHQAGEVCQHVDQLSIQLGRRCRFVVHCLGLA